jgi:transcription elongation factor Elf1
VREAFAQAEARLMCPRCNTELYVSPPVPRQGSILQEVSCPSCNRCVIVRNLPERPATF